MQQNRGHRYDETPKENSFGGFQYRWNYDEYQKTLQKKRRKTARHGMRAFFITTSFVFVVCFASLAVVLTAAHARGETIDGPGGSGRQPKRNAMRPSAASDPTTVTTALEQETVPISDETQVFDAQQIIDGKGTDAVLSEQNSTEFSEDVRQSWIETGVGYVETSTASSSGTEEPTVVVNAEQGAVLQQIAAACGPSTVSVLCENQTKKTIGSGFFLSEDGYLVTNCHVIRDFDAYQIVLQDGTSYDGILVMTEPSLDLALLRIDAGSLPAVTLGDSDEAAIGDFVVAIGTPASLDFAGSVTGGYISGVRRRFELTDEDKNIVGIFDMIQSTTVINPGNSGGPLFNVGGEVIGINTVKFTDNGYEGMGFSIPIGTVRPILEEWMTDDRIARGILSEVDIVVSDGAESEETMGDIKVEFSTCVKEPLRVPAVLGVEAETVTETEAALYRLPCGAMILSVEEGSNADTGGLLRDDIITEIDGQPILSDVDLEAWEAQASAGDIVSMQVFRDGETAQIYIVMYEVPRIAEIQTEEASSVITDFVQS